MRKMFTPAVMLLALAMLVVGCSNDPAPVQSPVTNDSALQLKQQIPSNATVDSARFFIYVTDSTTQSVTAHKVTTDWSETSVTWNTFGDNYLSDTAGSFMVDDTGWVSLDVTDLTREWFDNTTTNFGIVLIPAETDTTLAMYDSREATANMPYLEICYTTTEGSQCEMFNATADAYIYEAEADSNFGTVNELVTGREAAENSTRWSLIRAEFSVTIPPSELGGLVWDDSNGDGIQENGEVGIADVTIEAYDCTEDTLVATTMSGTDGDYVFDSLAPGEYYLQLTPPDGYVFSPMDVGDDDQLDSDFDPATGKTQCITTTPGSSSLDWDAGLYVPNTAVGNLVWDDTNMNGLQDEGEPGMADVVVRLYTCSDVLVDTTMTDSDGVYEFTQLDPGEYYLEFVNPYGYIFTQQDVGTNDSLDSDVSPYNKRTDCFTLSQGITDDTWDAGMYAYEGCTYGPGYWKNHAGGGPQCDEVTKFLPIWLGDEGGEMSIEISDAPTAIMYLTPTALTKPSNGIIKLYIKLLTAKLNIANFADPEEIYDTIQSVDDFLAMYDWNDWGSLDKDMQKRVLRWMGMLSDYNEGEIGPGSCGEDHSDCHCGDNDGDKPGDDDNGHDSDTVSPQNRVNY